MPATNTSVPAGEFATPTIALTAATVDTVTFADDCDMVEVWTSDGTALIYFTIGGATPASGAKNTYVVAASAGSALEVSVPTSGGTVVKLISSGTPSYRVTRTA